MNSSQRYVVTDGFCATNLNDSLVALVIENGKYYSFAKTGKTILQLLENPLSFDDLVAQLAATYNVTEEKCSAETAQFLLSVEAAGLIKRLP